MPVKGNASSRTTSAIAPGTIDIRENPTQDISALSRNTENALNELGRIFDKKKIEEQQELAAVFGEEAFRLAHNMKDDGSGRKMIVHAAIAGLMSRITGAGFTSGAVAGALNEALINSLKGLDPGIAQIVSAIIGAAAAKVAGGSAAAGASAAASGTKNNVALLAAVPEVAEVAAVASTQAPRIIPLIKGLGEAISKMGCVIAVVEGVQYIREIGTNEIVAQLQQDGTRLFNKTYSALESVFKEHSIPYSPPQTPNYITPPITVTPPDNERFPFDLSPNILDIKYKLRTNPLLDFKEQWSSQDFSDGNRFFSKGVEKEKADKAYPPADEHSSTNNPIKRTGKPNSSIDRVDEKGRIITRRWYDGNGRAKKDVDFTDHGNPKTHPQVPHEHTWEWDKNGNASRK